MELSSRRTVDREEGVLLYCYTLESAAPQRADRTAWFDAQQTPQPRSSEAFLVLRLLCEYET